MALRVLPIVLNRIYCASIFSKPDSNNRMAQRLGQMRFQEAQKSEGAWLNWTATLIPRSRDLLNAALLQVPRIERAPAWWQKEQTIRQLQTACYVMSQKPEAVVVAWELVKNPHLTLGQLAELLKNPIHSQPPESLPQKKWLKFIKQLIG